MEFEGDIFFHKHSIMKEYIQRHFLMKTFILEFISATEVHSKGEWKTLLQKEKLVAQWLSKVDEIYKHVQGNGDRSCG